MSVQRIIRPDNDYADIDVWLAENASKRVMLVCGKSINRLSIDGYFLGLQERSGIEVVRFTDFAPNPVYGSVMKGVSLFEETDCDSIIAVGGGSAMDVAKCIRIYSRSAADIPFLAVPTTAGTGSEATRFAVIYRDGVKQSVTDDKCIPDAVLFDSDVLRSLPDYHRKATMLDALCHAVESCWSVNSNEESRTYSVEAIHLIMDNMSGYLDNTDEGNRGMLRAANVAGKAINITQTTAGHAMCYKITGLFGCAHGHAAALCVRILFKWMCEDPGYIADKCIDPRGMDYLKDTLDLIGRTLGGEDARSGAAEFIRIFDELGMEVPKADPAQLDLLAASVNPDRLKNHPVKLDPDDIKELYRRILKIN